MSAKGAGIAQHSINVSHYAEAIAKQLRCSSSEIERIRKAALLHDIGKITIPDHILNKESRLTPEEYEVVKRHPMESVRILSGVDLCKLYIPGVQYHHERIDGGGYPDGLVGDDIPFDARVISVADAFEAMTSDRPFRARLPVEEAMRRLREGAGTQFDPVVVEAWEQIVDRTVAGDGGRVSS